MICSQCNREIPNDSEFCPYCGAKAPIVCHACKRPITEDSLFCPYCGVELPQPTNEGTEQQSTPREDWTSSNRTDDSSPAYSSNEAQVKHCKYCGGIIDNSTRKCSNCKKQFFRPRIIAIIASILVIAALLYLNIMIALLYYPSLKEKKEVMAEVSAKDAQIQELQEELSKIGG